MMIRNRKRGALEFSATTAVVIILAVVIIGAGIVFISSLRVELPSIDRNMPQFFTLSTSPDNAEAGTLFKINVDTNNNSVVILLQAKIMKDKELIKTIQLYDDGNHNDANAGDGKYAGFFDSKGQNEGIYQIDVVVNPGEKEAVYSNAGQFSIFKKQCIPLLYNGDPSNHIDVAILPSGYTNYSKFRIDALKLVDSAGRNNGILSYEPFKNNSGRFNFYLVNSSENLECTKGCQGVPSLVCCNDQKITRAASQCSSDEAFVILDSKDFCGSASAYAKICNGWNIGEVGTHEFGHIFGGLGDEYDYQKTYPNYKAYKAVYPNCDEEEKCPKWLYYWNKCIGGCGLSSYFRPTPGDCIMFTYVPQFCPVCQKTLLGLINKYNSPAPTKELSAPLPQESYVLDINYDKGSLKSQEVYFSPAQSPDRKAITKTDYIAKIVSFEGKEIYSFRFEMPRLLYPAPPRSPNETAYSPVLQENMNQTVIAPYFENAKSVEIYNPQNQRVLSIDVGYLAKTCGNGICEKMETAVDCPQDCKESANDGICIYEKDDVCDPDCRKGIDPDCSRIDWKMVGIMAISAVILAFLVFRRKKR